MGKGTVGGGGMSGGSVQGEMSYTQSFCSLTAVLASADKRLSYI